MCVLICAHGRFLQNRQTGRVGKMFCSIFAMHNITKSYLLMVLVGLVALVAQLSRHRIEKQM